MGAVHTREDRPGGSMGWGCRRRPRRSGPAHLCSARAVCSPLGLTGASTPPWLGSSSLPLGGGCAASQAAGPPRGAWPKTSEVATVARRTGESEQRLVGPGSSVGK